MRRTVRDSNEGNQLDAPDLVSEEQLKLAATLLKSGNLRSYEQFRQTAIARLSPINIVQNIGPSRSACAATRYEHAAIVCSRGGAC